MKFSKGDVVFTRSINRRYIPMGLEFIHSYFGQLGVVRRDQDNPLILVIVDDQHTVIPFFEDELYLIGKI